MSKCTVNVLYVPGTNSHKETLYAFERVGASPRLLMLKSVLSGNDTLDSADVLCIPGGFAYGDHLGAGALAGQFLRHKLSDQLAAVRRKPIIAICNGFQIAVRAGLFGDNVALTVNDSGTFRNLVRQRHHVEAGSGNVWLESLSGETLQFPCAHGEGKFLYSDTSGWRVALTYPRGSNPDGSTQDIAGITSEDGLVLGLMDHPERAMDNPGNLEIFAGGVRAAA